MKSQRRYHGVQADGSQGPGKLFHAVRRVKNKTILGFQQKIPVDCSLQYRLLLCFQTIQVCPTILFLRVTKIQKLTYQICHYPTCSFTYGTFQKRSRHSSTLSRGLRRAAVLPSHARYRPSWTKSGRMQRYTRTTSQNEIRSELLRLESQGGCAIEAGRAWSRRRAENISRATAFCTDCNLSCRSCFGRPANMSTSGGHNHGLVTGPQGHPKKWS